MTPNKLYKNKYNTDVAFEVKALISETEDTLTYLGKWVNISLTTPGYIDNDTIVIQKNQLSSWKEYRLNVSTDRLL